MVMINGQVVWEYFQSLALTALVCLFVMHEACSKTIEILLTFSAQL